MTKYKNKTNILSNLPQYKQKKRQNNSSQYMSKSIIYQNEILYSLKFPKIFYKLIMY